MSNTEYLTNTHILKILFNPKVPLLKGIKCFPEQTYGISPQSPEVFNSNYGLKAQNGYIYEEQQERVNKQLYLLPFSQKKYHSVIGNTIDVVGNFHQEYNKQKQKNTERFHRRRGRLSQFMDKNSWMKQMRPLMGFERGPQARQASNLDRQLKIKSARRPIPYINPAQKKISIPKQTLMNNSGLLTERAKLRSQRASLHKQKRDALDLQKFITITSKKSPQKDPYLDAENLTNRMSKTTNSKQWRETMSTIRQKFRKQQNSNQMMGLTKSDWSTNNQSVCLKPRLIQQKDQLKDWFNTTCNSKANPWKYRKARKMATGSDEQILD